MEWAHIIAGLGVGLLVGLTGVGGGSLMTPILVLAFGFAPAAAVGTDLWFAAITKMVGGSLHHSRRSIDWQVLRRLWLGSLPAALATLAWLQATGSQGSHSHARTLLGQLLQLQLQQALGVGAAQDGLATGATEGSLRLGDEPVQRDGLLRAHRAPPHPRRWAERVHYRTPIPSFQPSTPTV